MDMISPGLPSLTLKREKISSAYLNNGHGTPTSSLNKLDERRAEIILSLRPWCLYQHLLSHHFHGNHADGGSVVDELGHVDVEQIRWVRPPFREFLHYLRAMSFVIFEEKRVPRIEDIEERQKNQRRLHDDADLKYRKRACCDSN